MIYLLGSFLILNILLYLTRHKSPKLIKNKSCKYAILIPAKDESLVIEKTLLNIQKENKDMSNTYVIIEDKKDPTYKIAKKYKANVYIRKTNIKTKGGAIDECLKSIINKDYDLYFILDADNIITKDYFKKMLKHYKDGYDVLMSYRIPTNPVNWVSIDTGMLFASHFNLLNGYRKIFNLEPISYGSGQIISSKIIKELNGFPFYSITEDYEFSIYLEENHIRCINSYTPYFDEQPTSIKESINQRTRWIRGVMNNKYHTRTLNKTIWDLAVLNLVLILIYLIGSFFIYYKYLGIIFTYLLIVLISIFILILDNNRIKLSFKKKLLFIFTNPIFLSTYAISYIKALTNKNLGWYKTNHKG